MAEGAIFDFQYSGAIFDVEYENNTSLFSANKQLNLQYSSVLQDGFKLGTGDDLKGFVLTTPTQLFYNTIYFDPSFFNLGNISVSRVEEINVWNAFLKPVTLSKLDYDTSQGVLIETSSNNNFNALELKVFKLKVDKNGSPLVNISANFSFSNGFKFVLPITGSRTLIVSYIPDKQFSETITFKTEISQSQRKELRAKLYSDPIRKYNYRYLIDEELLSHFSNLFNSAQSKQYLVPTWQEMMLLKNGISSGTKTITIDEELRGFNENSQILLWVDEFNTYTTKIIKRNANTITFKDSIPRKFERCFIIPCELYTIQDSISMSREYENNIFRANITYTQNNANLNAKQLDLPLLKGEPVFNIGYIKGNILSQQKVTFINDTFANPFQHIEQDKGLFKLSGQIIRNSLKDYHKWLDFLNFCSGRFKAFWLPTNFNDLTLAADAKINHAFLELKHSVSINSRNAVMISFAGQTFYSKIKNNVVENGITRIILEENLPFNLQLGTNYRISLMYRVRLNEDEQTIEHEDYYTKSISFATTEIL